MRLSIIAALLLATPVYAQPVYAQPAPAPVAALIKSVDIPHDQFTLPNGLTVIVHTDRKAPIVAISVWYHIGSRDEPAGKTGFAHLFEHLMFGGSENVPEFDKLMDDIGQSQANGSTWYDRTNYFENVPTPALETALFVESDRMGHLLGAVTQRKLDLQRGVVQNEKRQGDNRPFGMTRYAIGEGLFPVGHPYRHSTIGSMADLDAASLDTVRDWFRANYGPNNAVLVLAGDIDSATARVLVTRYFGDIPRGPEPVRYVAPVPVRTVTTRETMTDAIANPRLIRSYVIPGRPDPSVPLVDVAATILAGGETSRLYTDLVRDKLLAVNVSGGVQPFEKISMVQFQIDVKAGVDPKIVEARIDQLFAQFLKSGPSADEVQRVATSAVAGTIRGLEAVGGDGGKAVSLAEGAVYAGNADFYKTELMRYADATPHTVLMAARKWLAHGDFRLTVLPGKRIPRDTGDSPAAAGDAQTNAVVAKAIASAPPVSGAARIVPVLPAIAPELTLPPLDRFTLSNGIQVTLARRTTIPTVIMSMSFDAGFAADDRARPGTEGLMLAMLTEGTTSRTGLDIAKTSERLAADISAGNGFDTTRLTLSALKPNLAASLDLFADVARNPAFDATELERVRGQALAGIAQEARDPASIARRAFVPLLFGPSHPYGVPGSGAGTDAGVKAVTRADLIAFHQRWLRPDNAQLFVVGDVTAAELQPLLEASLGNWKPPAVAKGSKAFPPLRTTPSPRIILIDRPGSPQSYIRAGELLPISGRDDPFVLDAANDLIGGGLTARLNADLREAKGWSYGVGSRLSEGVDQTYAIVVAPVQTDRTGDAIAAIITDYAALKGTRPLDDTERTKVVNSNARSLPGAFESGGAVLGAIERNALLGRPDDYYRKLPARYQALTTAELNGAAAMLDAGKFVWVVVGDAKLVEPQLAKLGLPLEVRR